MARQATSTGDVTQYSLMKEPADWLTDSNVVALAAIVNQSAARLARMETESSTDPNVHVFALQVLRDHNAIQATLDSLASAHRIIAQPPAIQPELRAPYDSIEAQLARVTGAAFPAAFLDAELAVHQRAREDFAAIAGNATDPDLRAILANRASSIEDQHIAMIDQLKVSLVRADSTRQDSTHKRKP